MTRSIRRQLRFLHAYAVTTSLILVVLAVSAFRQPKAPPNMGEITAERINIVDANGTLRLVISNKDRMHPGVIGGKVLQRPRPLAGLLFFNDQGDEAGGLTLTGREADGHRVADAGLMFDQLGQDQTIGFDYTEEDGQRTAGSQGVGSAGRAAGRSHRQDQRGQRHSGPGRARRGAGAAACHAFRRPLSACSSARPAIASRA